MTRRILASLLVTALALAVVARADNPINLKVDPKKTGPKDEAKLDEKAVVEEAAIKQARLSEDFRKFEGALLRLAQRLESSSKAEDREKAVVLKKAIDRAMNEGVDTKFDRLVNALKTSKAITPDYLQGAMDQNKELANDIRTILAILLTDNRDEELRKEKERLQELIRRLNEIIRAQQTVRAWTDRDSMEKNRLAREQNKVSEATAWLARSLGKGDPKNGAERRGESKGEGKKGTGGKGEAKEDTRESKGDPKSREGANAGKNEDRENKGGAKGGEGNDKENKGGSKAGGDQQGDKENKGGAKSGEGNDKENKGGAKAGEGNDKENRGGAKGDQKENAQPGAGKPSAEAQGDKAGGKEAGKPDEGKQGAGKEAGKQGGQQAGKGGAKADPKGRGDGKGQSKGQQQSGQQGGQSGGQQGGQQQSGQQQQGQSKGQQGGQQGGQQQQGQSKGDGQQGGQQQQQAEDQPPDDTPGRKKIQDANLDQRRAEDNIDKNKRADAGKNQDEAIEKLIQARKKWEELLRQIREEENERLLAQLQARCERMLAMQIEVKDGTVATAHAVEANADKKPSRAEVQKSLQLADREDEIVREASKAITLLETEGSAVAFPEVFIQLRSDMENVSRRLRATDVDSLTQTIEQDIIDTLKEMVEALKKAQKDQQAKKQQQQQQGGGNQDEKLIDLIAELKMIRSLQIRVNTRTKLYGQEYEGREQAPVVDPAMPPEQKEKLTRVRKEVKDLADRQEKIFEVTENSAKGRNK